MPTPTTTHDTKSNSKALIDFGCDQYYHAGRLLDEDKYDLAVEYLERVATYAQGARELLLELAERKSRKEGYAFVQIRPDGKGGFTAAVLEEGKFRVFASGPYTELVKAVHGAGLSSAAIESRFIVPTLDKNITHYLSLEKVDAA